VLARPILFRAGPCFKLLFSDRASAGPRNPTYIPSTSHGSTVVYTIDLIDTREEMDEIISGLVDHANVHTCSNDLAQSLSIGPAQHTYILHNDEPTNMEEH
jgi:hypothetical protein